MHFRLLELHFSQLQSEWKNAKYNNYSDLRKKEYHESLARIIQALEMEDFKSFSEKEIKQRFYVIFFLFKSLEFLNNSTTSTIPFEIVFVLTEALKDWTSTNEYIIVTSLNNNINSFSFDNSLMFNQFFYTDIELLYGVTFDRKLIQINLPRSISSDYLANVVLYHELGHFIDRKYEITRVAYVEIIQKILSDNLKSDEKNDIISFFPYLSDITNVKHLEKNFHPDNILSNHIGEYFCDVFASQYIRTCSNDYLNYMTLGQNNYSNTHPSTVNRILCVENFLDSKNSYLIELYKKIVENITSKKLEIKASSISSRNLEKLIPVEIQNKEELHSLFSYGWKVWLNEWNEIERHSNIEFELNQVKVYEIINNLIEKSIGNYIVREEWRLAKM